MNKILFCRTRCFQMCDTPQEIKFIWLYLSGPYAPRDDNASNTLGALIRGFCGYGEALKATRSCLGSIPTIDIGVDFPIHCLGVIISNAIFHSILSPINRCHVQARLMVRIAIGGAPITENLNNGPVYRHSWLVETLKFYAASFRVTVALWVGKS